MTNPDTDTISVRGSVGATSSPSSARSLITNTDTDTISIRGSVSATSSPSSYAIGAAVPAAADAAGIASSHPCWQSAAATAAPSPA